MITFQVDDMTCGRCASAISRAVASVDRAARLEIRIQEKIVRVDSEAPATELAQAIQDAGYTPRELLQDPARPAAVDVRQQAAPGGGSCCR